MLDKKLLDKNGNYKKFSLLKESPISYSDSSGEFDIDNSSATNNSKLKNGSISVGCPMPPGTESFVWTEKNQERLDIIMKKVNESLGR